MVRANNEVNDDRAWQAWMQTHGTKFFPEVQNTLFNIANFVNKTFE